jgi:hypothetical protein
MTGARRWIGTSAVLLAALLWGMPAPARAYPWMIKHDYLGCGVCHADPSGGGLLTPYGRAQSEILMRMPYGRSPEEEPKYAGFLFGLVDLPDWLLTSLSFRGAVFGLRVDNPDGSYMTDLRFIMMLLDARAMIKLGAFRAGGSIGWGNTIVTTPAAIVTTNDGTEQLLSRDYWIGLALDDERVLLRLGRINVPYGLRNVEHTSWVRSLTGTDINISQQTGLAASYANGSFRTEWLLMLGNLRATDTGYREQGFSGYAELRVAPRAGVGLSALVGRGHSFVEGEADYLRQNYGAFVRWAPIVPVTFLLEGDVFFNSKLGSGQNIPNGVGWFQTDWEPIQGLHIMPAAEILKAQDTSGVATGWWLTLDWYFLPHTDLRLDGIWRDSPAQGGRQQVLSWLIQIHVYL